MTGRRDDIQSRKGEAQLIKRMHIFKYISRRYEVIVIHKEHLGEMSVIRFAIHANRDI